MFNHISYLSKSQAFYQLSRKKYTGYYEARARSVPYNGKRYGERLDYFPEPDLRRGPAQDISAVRAPEGGDEAFCL
jgi:hypothetical protein